MDSKIPNRQYIPAYGVDYDALEHGKTWLLSGSQDEALVLYVPTLEQLSGSPSTALTTFLGEETAKQFVKTGKLTIDGKTINLITEEKTIQLEKPMRLLACWADSESIERIETNYDLSSILVITWNSKHDITDWKLKKCPTQFVGYTPPITPEDWFTPPSQSDSSTAHESTIDQEMSTVTMKRPHVVVLGAGASRATCPEGDKNGKKIPLMQDFAEVLDLKSLLQVWGISPDQNFEEIFSDLYEKQETKKLEEITKLIDEYFEQLELPDKPTIYDHLVLSLREKDMIATFNWDPLLLQAYFRNQKSGLKLPQLLFLHGNVRVGYCKKDNSAGPIERPCKKCGKPFERSPLLYPIKKKDYTKNIFISREWERLKWGFQNAFMITIFGYSGPKTDVEAISAMKGAWGDTKDRSLEETTFITTRSKDETYETWQSFIHTHHYEVHSNFYDSWIANHPRRTGEAFFMEKLDAMFIDNNPIPNDVGFPELWHWFEQFKKAES